MITEEKAIKFAQDWISAWNDHELDRILSHYDENIEYSSVFIANLTENKKGMLQGKKSVKEYLAKGLEKYPDLHFELINIYTGIGSIVINYRSVNNLLAAEEFEFNDRDLVSRVKCHYCQEH